MKTRFLALSVLLLVLCGCKKKIEPTTGDFTLNLTSEGAFTPILKSNPDEVDINTFKVVIKGEQSGSVVNSWGSFGSMPQVVAMEPGRYTIEATSPGDKVVAFNQPLYKGSQNFVVEAGKVVTLDLTCTLQNMKVSVRCTNKFITELNDDFSIKVSSKDGFLIFNKDVIDRGADQAGYYNVSPLTIDLKATRKLDNSQVSHHFTVSEVAAKDHHIFTFDVHETGQIQLGGSGISVDYTVNNKEVDIQVGDLDENPVEDDLTGKPSLQNCSIESGAVVATTIGSITLNYDLPIALKPNHGITIGSVEVTAQTDNKALTISFGDLDPDTEYSLNIPAGAIVNATDQTPADSYTLSFRTSAAQTVVVPITIQAPGVDTPASYVVQQIPSNFSLNIHADNKIKELWFEVHSPLLLGLMSGFKVGGRFNLADLNDAELEFWGGLFGFSEKNWAYNKSDVSMALGTLLNMVDTPDTYNFTITVKDLNNNVLEKTLSLNLTAE